MISTKTEFIYRLKNTCFKNDFDKYRFIYRLKKAFLQTQFRRKQFFFFYVPVSGPRGTNKSSAAAVPPYPPSLPANPVPVITNPAVHVGTSQGAFGGRLDATLDATLDGGAVSQAPKQADLEGMRAREEWELDEEQKGGPGSPG